MDREEALRRVQILNFVVADTALYLDTHPMDVAALNFYDKYRSLLMQAEDEFTSMYGPLTQDTVNTAYGWTWIDKPWPWEMEE